MKNYKNIKSLSYVMLTFTTTIFSLLTIGYALFILFKWHFNYSNTGISFSDVSIIIEYTQIKVWTAIPLLVCGIVFTIFYAYGCEYIKRSEDYNNYFLAILWVLSGFISLAPIVIYKLVNSIKINK